MALLYLADRETSGTGTTVACLGPCTRVVPQCVTDFVVDVVPEQTAEQRLREVEAADAASVARLVRGVSVALTPPPPSTNPLKVSSRCLLIAFYGLWLGGCGSWRAASSCCTQPVFPR